MSFGEHTSKSIIGSKSSILSGKKLVLCVTGSVAAIKSPEIARELMRQGAEVFCVMSPMSQRIIHPDMLEWSTGNPVVTELTGEIEHVTYAGEHEERADLILVAPSTANTIGKVASGIDDPPVTTLLTTGIGAGIPVIIAPAMHSSMYNHPIVMENIEKLEEIGIKVLMPRIEEEKAKIPGTDDIVQSVIYELTSNKMLRGKKVIITGGPTRVYLDAFRYITNPSSGKTGVALAERALNSGAEVTLVYGPGSAKPPSNVKIINVETTEEMLNAVISELESTNYDVAILSAAVADYGPREREISKTPSKMEKWSLKLYPLPKIIERVKEVAPEIYLVGFKAEYEVSDEELIERSKNRMEEADIDLMVANDVSRTGIGFGTDKNEVFIITSENQVIHIPITDKYNIADRILEIISKSPG
ncbi:MAG: bifunctional phosphopantothenoylcysteine decarboxylase/phosphopantothenate--cysteine ligase CoaBC [Candidatus Bathyarchaeia archaeon]